MSPVHVPVLRDPVVALLSPAAPGLLVDATVGPGGHAEALLEAAPGFTLLGLDRDPRALELARRRLERFGSRVTLLERRFSQLPEVLATRAEPAPAAILADLGCSSLQLDTPERGFSFRHDAPLDMRMGAHGPTAADLLAEAEEEELVRILWRYGEERRSRAIARAMVRRRRERPLRTTRDLAELVVEVLGPGRRGRVHPATRTFQALRIAVNDELGELERFLEPAVRSLRPGGAAGGDLLPLPGGPHREAHAQAALRPVLLSPGHPGVPLRRRAAGAPPHPPPAAPGPGGGREQPPRPLRPPARRRTPRRGGDPVSRPAVYRPTPGPVIWQGDRQWPRVLAASLAVGAVVAGLLLAVGWPRLQTIAVHYDLVRLRVEVAALERQERVLSVQLERRRNPAALGRAARALGLGPPSPEQIRVPGEEVAR